jgi:hypothetical protein
LFFNVFTIINAENKVNVKYKTKNNITDDNPVFLATKNQTKARTSSSRNLRVTETRLCIVWLAGSFPCPLKKIMIVNKEIKVNIPERRAISPKLIPIPDLEMIKNPAARKRHSSIASSWIYLKTGFIPNLFFQEFLN